MSEEQTFYLVWAAPTVSLDKTDEKWDSKPRIQHRDYGSAQDEAMRLANETRRSFYILKAIGKVESEFNTRVVSITD